MAWRFSSSAFSCVAALLVLLMSVEFADSFQTGIGEFYALVLFALSGMLFASSVNDFALLFVSLELITVTFYVLTSFQRTRLTSLEAGVKYLIIGALSTSFTVFGIALVYGISHQLNFGDLAAVAGQYSGNRLFLCGVVLVMVGLGFKIAAFPFQIWAPDVYQGAPSPTTAFLAVGSKAAGFVLLLRVLFTAVPAVTAQWSNLLIVISAITILYGNLCAIPQRNIKRLLGYSSIAHAGYMLLGIAALAVSLSQRRPTLDRRGLRRALLPERLSFHRAGRLHRDLPGAAAGRGRRHRRAGRLEPALAAAGRHDGAGDGLAGRHSAPGRFLRQIPAAQSPSSPRPRPIPATIAWPLPPWPAWSFPFTTTSESSARCIGPAKPPACLRFRTSGPMRLSLYACAAGMLFLGCVPRSDGQPRHPGRPSAQAPGRGLQRRLGA